MKSSDQAKTLLARKNLDPTLLQADKEDSKTTTFDLQKISQTLFNTIYSRSYISDNDSAAAIKRHHHGIQHVSRVAHYIPVFTNLYRRYGDPEAPALTERTLQLLTIAALFHDAARENEDVDLWDKESALLCYFYLKDVLKVDADEAALIAEAIANKDQENGVYFKLHESKTKPDEYEWKEEPRPQKNILQKIIHDADCLDILRARDCFDANYLDFYKDHAKTNPKALDEMATAITEGRKQNTRQGDGRRVPIPKLKLAYNNDDAFSKISAALKKEDFPLLATLHAGGKLLSDKLLQQKILDDTLYEAKGDLNVENVRAAIREGRVFGRGFENVTGLRPKESPHGEELMAQLEIRKTYRKKDLATRTLKQDRMNKEGNPARSIFMMGWGAEPFSNVGFMLINPDLKGFSSVKEVDADTSRGKKKYFIKEIKPMPVADTKAMLKDVLRKHKMGGSIRSDGSKMTHSEMTYHLKHYDAIYYSDDKGDSMGEKYYTNYCLLHALYLQQEHEKMTKKKLPIFRYSAAENAITKPNLEFKDEELINLWMTMCSEYMENRLGSAAFYSMTLQEIKTCGRPSSKSADLDYPAALRVEIDKRIETLRTEKLKQHRDKLFKAIKKKPRRFVVGNFFMPLMQIAPVDVTPELKSLLQKEITDELAKHQPMQALSQYPRYPELELKSTEEEIIDYTYKEDTGQAVKAYNLALKWGLIAEAQALQNRASDFVLASLKNPLIELKNFINYKSLTQLINIAVSYNIYPKFEKDIHRIIEAAFEEINRKLDAKKEYYSVLYFIDYCMHQQFPFSERMKKITAAALHQDIEKLKAEGDASDDLAKYLRIAQTCQFPKAQQCDVVYQFMLKSYTHYFYGEKLFPALAQADLLSNLLIFNLLITHIRAENLVAFDKIITSLQSFMPQRSFSKEQALIIEKQRTLFTTFHQNNPTAFINGCKEAKVSPHYVFAGCTAHFDWMKVMAFIEPFILSDRFLRQASFFGLDESLEKSLSEHMVAEAKSKLDVLRYNDAFKPVLTYCKAVPPTIMMQFGTTSWKEETVNPAYTKAWVLTLHLTHQEVLLSKEKFSEYLDKFLSNPSIITYTDKAFQTAVQTWHNTLKPQKPSNALDFKNRS
jgi:hypothetical protein